MRHFLAFLFFLIPLLSTFAQIPANILDKWESKEIEQAKTGKAADYLSQLEKEVIFYSNLVRINPALFERTILADYVKSNSISKSPYVKSLKKELIQLMPMDPLYPQKDLYDIAFKHAEVSGKNGSTGHQNFKSRTSGAIRKYRKLGENCEYGSNTALDIVLELLIDEGIQDLGHRKNMLSPLFVNIGVAQHSHKKYRTNTVIIYGGDVTKLPVQSFKD